MEQTQTYRFHKIKYRPAKEGKKLNTYFFVYDIIRSRDAEGNENKAEYTLICHDEPVEKFKKELQSLKPLLLDLCEQQRSTSVESRTEVRGITLNYAGEKNTLGLIISGIMRYKKSNGVLVLNTPHKTEHFYNKQDSGDENQLIPVECCKVVYELFDLAKRYIEGERTQVEMEFKKKKKENVAEMFDEKN